MIAWARSGNAMVIANLAVGDHHSMFQNVESIYRRRRRTLITPNAPRPSTDDGSGTPGNVTGPICPIA
jgi:hypothetical protein